MSSLKLIHTADWHLGHKLHGVDRTAEHRAFLSWLIDLLTKERPQALLISGDIFDTSNPPYSAQALWYDFLTECRRARPGLDVIAVAGNHDSAAGLEAPGKIFEELGVRVLGSLSWDGSQVDVDRMVVPVHGDDGVVAANVVAVPFLRAPDVWRLSGGEGERRAVERIYAEAFARAQAASKEIPVVAMGHLYISGTKVSELSERRIVRGGQEAVSREVFCDGFAYTALGHLHLAQGVGKDDVRYSGSPIPLSMNERVYRHGVNLVTLDSSAGMSWETRCVPRARELLRIPDRGALSKEEALAGIEDLQPRDWDLPPLLEVCVELKGPQPTLRSQVEDALDGKGVRLVRLAVELPGSKGDLFEDVGGHDVSSVDPVRVFQAAFERVYGGDPDPELESAFVDLLADVGEGRP